ncbi:MAG TPA: hypothetical protein VF586_21835 [Pyrinomonadaceae bacterium]|jgi:hypothetical protein
MIVAHDEPRNLFGRGRRVVYLKALAAGHGREEVVTPGQLAQRVGRGQLAGPGPAPLASYYNLAPFTSAKPEPCPA